jgi:hypothetical protein
MEIYIPSAGRPGNVEKHPMGLVAFWVVPEDEADAYAEAGACTLPIGSRESAARARNAILDHAGQHFPESMLAMVDDDIVRVEQVNPDTGEKWPILLATALGDMADRLASSDLRLMGAAPTTNAYFTKRRTSFNLFAKSGTWVVRSSELRLDEGLRVKEDYDFNLQHYTAFGGWLRADDILVHSAKPTPTGGCAPLRATNADAEAVEYLLAKWPGLVRAHSTRVNEVTLTIPKARRFTT